MIRISDPKELVLDPFAGSGSMGVAMRLVANLLAGNCDPEYAETARLRLRAAREQLELSV